jgi:hypothetical protein
MSFLDHIALDGALDPVRTRGRPRQYAGVGMEAAGSSEALEAPVYKQPLPDRKSQEGSKVEMDSLVDFEGVDIRRAGASPSLRVFIPLSHSRGRLCYRRK